MALGNEELRSAIDCLIIRNLQLRQFLTRLLDNEDHFGRITTEDVQDEIRRVLAFDENLLSD
jgi:hypothetical protein